MKLPKAWQEEFKVDEREVVYLGGKTPDFNYSLFEWDDYSVNPILWDYMHSFGTIGFYVDDDGYVVYVDMDKAPEYPIVNRGDGFWKKEQRERLKKLRPILNLPTREEWIANLEREERLKGSTNIAGDPIEPLDNRDVFGSMAPSPTYPTVPITADDDPYSGNNIALAELAVGRYRQQKPQAPYHLVIGPYPVPELLNELSNVYCDMPYWEVEVTVGQLIHQKWSETWDIVSIRSMCFLLMSQETSPIDFITKMKVENIYNLEGYIAAKFRNTGVEWVRYPTSPFPLTLVQQPLKATVPAWDKDITITGKKLRLLATELGTDFPAESSEESLSRIRDVTEKRREKALEARKSKGS